MVVGEFFSFLGPEPFLSLFGRVETNEFACIGKKSIEAEDSRGPMFHLYCSDQKDSGKDEGSQMGGSKRDAGFDLGGL